MTSVWENLTVDARDPARLAVAHATIARFGSEFDLHLAGMWVNFVIAAVLIVLFVNVLSGKSGQM